MDLRPFFLHEWDPIIFHNGRIYVVGEGSSDGTITAYRKSLNLMKLDNVEVYENVFLDHSKSHIEQFQREFLEQTINKEMNQNSAAQKALDENHVLSFIIKEVLPALTQKQAQEEIANLLGLNNGHSRDYSANPLGSLVPDISVQEDNQMINHLIMQIEAEYAHLEQALRQSSQRAHHDNNDIESILRNTYAQEGNIRINYQKNKSQYIENQIDSILEKGTFAPVRRTNIEEEDTDESILKKVLLNSTAVFGDRVYNLVESSNNSEFVISLGRKRFTAQWSQPLNKLFEQYKLLLEKKFKIDALRNDGTQSSALAQAQRERQELRTLLNTENFEQSGVGFFKKSTRYHVYVETPEHYALKSPHNGKYYLFDKVKIAVPLKKESNRIYVERPYLVGSYHHPFISGPGTNKPICLGDYSYDSARNRPPLDSVLTYLSDSKNVILSGYGTGGNPYRKLDDSNFQNQQISESELRRRKIPVTNKSVVSSRSRRWD